MSPARRQARRTPVPGTPRGSLRGSTTVRIRVALIVVAMVVSLFGARLFQLQGLDPKAYAARAAQAGLVKLTLPAKRGEILDRNGVPLAESVVGRMVVADPTRTAGDAEAIARILTDSLGVDYFDSLTALRNVGPDPKRPLRFGYIARRVPSTLAATAVAKVNQAGYQGIALRPDPLRTYPAQDVAANMIGFIGNDPQADGTTAKGGLELTFDKRLSGTDGSQTYESGGGNRIPLGENSQVDPVNGQGLKLTIDRDLQWFTQRALRNAVEFNRAESGTAIVMDTRTGEVLALADAPTFDPNHFGKADDSDRGTRSLGTPFEPGSVEKVLTSAALIDAGLVTPETKITVPSELVVDQAKVKDYFEHGTLRLTLAGVIAKSSNIGTTLAARAMDDTRLYDYLQGFGLGSAPGTGLRGESRGRIPQRGTWSALSQSNIAFGQGLSVSAVQMTASVNAIANGGEYVSPSIIEGRARTDSGEEVGTDTAVRRRVVSASAARQVSEMMEMVTTEGSGTAPGAKVPGYRTAGKTGTAQQVNPKTLRYDWSDAAFGGFAPADDPRFTVYVVLHHPKSGEVSGGGMAGPVFRRVLSYALQRYAVPPTETTPAALPVEW